MAFRWHQTAVVGNGGPAVERNSAPWKPQAQANVTTDQIGQRAVPTALEVDDVSCVSPSCLHHEGAEKPSGGVRFKALRARLGEKGLAGAGLCREQVFKGFGQITASP